MTIKFVFDWDAKYKMGVVKSDYIDNLREAMSVEDKSAAMAQYRRGFRFTNTRKYAITPAGRFSVGVFPEIYKYIQTLSQPYQCIITEKFKEQFTPSYISNDEYEIKSLNLKCRPYQRECVLKCLTHGNGVCVVATAGGKTLIMATLIHNILNLKKSKILLITTPQLVTQSYKDFIEYGVHKHWTLSRWDGDNNYTEADIVIASNTILMSKKQDISVINKYDVIINDECHKARSGNKINKILKKNTSNHKYGFTGSLPESKIDLWNIVGQLGPIIYEKKGDDLRQMGFISKASAIICKLNYKTPPTYKHIASISDPTGMYNEEYDFLCKNDFRNKTIATLCKNVSKNTLILVDRLDHQQRLIDYIKTHAPDKDIKYVRGEVEKEARDEIKHLMEKNNNIVCIAMSSIFATGINIKNIHYLIFAMPGKAKIRLLQSIGRGLRLHESKSELIIFDIADVLHYGLKHLEHRVELYEEENIKYVIKEIYET